PHEISTLSLHDALPTPRGCELHRYICGIGQHSGRSSALTWYWFCALGSMSGLAAATMGGADYTCAPCASGTSVAFHSPVTATRVSRKSAAGTMGAAAIV